MDMFILGVAVGLAIYRCAILPLIENDRLKCELRRSRGQDFFGGGGGDF